MTLIARYVRSRLDTPFERKRVAKLGTQARRHTTACSIAGTLCLIFADERVSFCGLVVVWLAIFVVPLTEMYLDATIVILEM
jgi:hypothetical protein